MKTECIHFIVYLYRDRLSIYKDLLTDALPTKPRIIGFICHSGSVLPKIGVKGVICSKQLGQDIATLLLLALIEEIQCIYHLPHPPFPAYSQNFVECVNKRIEPYLWYFYLFLLIEHFIYQWFHIISEKRSQKYSLLRPTFCSGNSVVHIGSTIMNIDRKIDKLVFIATKQT